MESNTVANYYTVGEKRKRTFMEYPSLLYMYVSPLLLDILIHPLSISKSFSTLGILALAVQLNDNCC